MIKEKNKEIFSRKPIPKVVVAMSGGVDSAFAAFLMKRAGFEVEGVFMRLWSESGKEGEILENQKRAQKAAKKIGIPFTIVDLQKEFKREVVNYFLKEASAGQTPNPCVICNKKIKFGFLLKKALVFEADYLATGHYVKKRKTKEGYKLFRAKDKNKDQSYFLWMLNQEQLTRLLFPLGNYRKKQVRELSRKQGLPTMNAPESHEICFIKNDVAGFFSKYLKARLGRIIDKKGKEVGRHQGLFLYTIGQRKGLQLNGGPYYVLSKDAKRNLLIVTKNEKDLKKKETTVGQTSWISGKTPKLPLRVKTKIRYRQDMVSATIEKKAGKKSYRLVFKKSPRAVTPGQSAVFYREEEMLGGGIIR